MKIDKGIKIPPIKKIKRKTLYPWEKMKIGDSFFVAEKNLADMRSQVSHAKRKYSNNYYTDRWIEKGVKGVRVWRIK